jgi:hypothetical protein
MASFSNQTFQQHEELSKSIQNLANDIATEHFKLVGYYKTFFLSLAVL